MNEKRKLRQRLTTSEDGDLCQRPNMMIEVEGPTTTACDNSLRRRSMLMAYDSNRGRLPTTPTDDGQEEKQQRRRKKT